MLLCLHSILIVKGWDACDPVRRLYKKLLVVLWHIPIFSTAHTLNTLFIPHLQITYTIQLSSNEWGYPLSKTKVTTELLLGYKRMLLLFVHSTSRLLPPNSGLLSLVRVSLCIKHVLSSIVPRIRIIDRSSGILSHPHHLQQPSIILWSLRKVSQHLIRLGELFELVSLDSAIVVTIRVSGEGMPAVLGLDFVGSGAAGELENFVVV